ncbi:MAG: type II toxin-antitoxin system prevent-host-death family antitoxin [Chthoniobacterales bacterium]|nr:type II toxin-antitoxin system prevent-host-death family antitoxin [Chthoniobacterales bacterium]
MKVLNIHQAKTHLSRLIEEAVKGETVVVAKAGKPMIQLVPVAASGGDRPLGLLASQSKESADCWAPDKEVERWFYGDEKTEAPRVAE